MCREGHGGTCAAGRGAARHALLLVLVLPLLLLSTAGGRRPTLWAWPLLLLVWGLLLWRLCPWWRKHVGPACIVEAVDSFCKIRGHVLGLEEWPMVGSTPHACHCCRRSCRRCCRHCRIDLPSWRPLQSTWGSCLRATLRH